MKKYTLSALLAAGLLAGAAGSASAADLGGNCCADLEERIAELEATTARKGNRKVSLTVSGWVAEQVMWWDDGVESNTYVTGIGTTLASNVKFSGSAQIAPGWSAGYLIHVEFDGSDSLLQIDHNSPSGPSVLGHGLDFAQTVQSYWFVKSEQLGKVSVGLISQASDNTAILVDGSGSLVPANFVPFDYGGFKLRTPGGAPTATRLVDTFLHSDLNGIPVNAVRYDSPTFGGFSVSASWGQDDMWDVAARYAGEFGGFKLAVAAAYNETTDSSGLPNNCCGGQDWQHFQVGAYVQHVASGIFLYGAWSDSQLDDDPSVAGISTTDGNSWYVKAGLRQRWSSLGHSVVFGEYLGSDMETNSVTSGNFELWGGGIVQEIDAAAMSIWLTYRHIEADNALSGAALQSLDFDHVKFGALINF